MIINSLEILISNIDLYVRSDFLNLSILYSYNMYDKILYYCFKSLSVYPLALFTSLYISYIFLNICITKLKTFN